MSNKILCFISCIYLLLSSIALMKYNALVTNTDAWIPFKVPLRLDCFLVINLFPETDFLHFSMQWTNAEILKASGYFSDALLAVSWSWRTAVKILVSLKHGEFLPKDSFSAMVRSLQPTEAQKGWPELVGCAPSGSIALGSCRDKCHSPCVSLYLFLPWWMLIHKCEGVCMPMQLTEQYAFTSCSAVLCCETEMTVCGWSMCLNSAVQIRNNKQLEVLWTNKTLPLKSLQQCCLTFIATQAVCVPLILKENHTAQSLPGCQCLTTPRQARVLLYAEWPNHGSGVCSFCASVPVCWSRDRV